LFVSGNRLMRVRPCVPVWRIEQSTVEALRGQTIKISMTRSDADTAKVMQDASSREWTVLEWADVE